MPLPPRARPNHDDHDDDDVQYLSLDQLVRYSGLSIGTLRRYLKAADTPLPHLVVRSPGKTSGRGRVLVPRREFDTWMRATFGPKPATPGAVSSATDIDAWVERTFARVSK